MSHTRDINWDVDFNITVDGEDKRFWELTETEQDKILEDIRDDYYSGTFLGDDEDEEN